MSYNPFYGFTEAGVTPPPSSAIEHRPQGGPGYEVALRNLMTHMIEISGDPSGSYPEDYLDPDDAAVCRRVVGLANHLGWPSSSELGPMEVPKFDLYPARNSRLGMAKAGLTKLLFFKEAGEPHQAYVLGRLGASVDQLVALCDDGLLRSMRSHELDRSNGLGWGRLPDADLLNNALGIGRTHGVEFENVSTNPKSKTLAGKLLENVPPNLLDDATLAHFGLTGFKRLRSHDLIERTHGGA